LHAGNAASGAGNALDETEIDGDRFTLLAPDAYDDAYLDIVLRDGAGNELVRESLYEDDDDE